MAGVGSSTPTEGNFTFCWTYSKPLNVQKWQICVENENLYWSSQLQASILEVE